LGAVSRSEPLLQAASFWTRKTAPPASSFAVVLLSLLDSFISSVIFAVVGAALLNYFFTEPINSLGISTTADLFSLVAFLVTSLAVTTLVRRIGRVEKTQRAQAQLLELTHDIIIVRDKNDVITYWNQAAETLYGWKKGRGDLGSSSMNFCVRCSHCLETSWSGFFFATAGERASSSTRGGIAPR
jgi:PAS domain-containing protein